MSIDQAIDTGQAAVLLALTLCGPALLAAVTVGLALSLLQALTGLQDATIGFVPRLVTVLIVLVCTGAWMCERLVDYSITLYRNIPNGL